MDKQWQSIATENHNLIYKFLHKYDLDENEYYDLAAIGFCKACMTYDSSYKTSLSTYAFKCMFNSVFSSSNYRNGSNIFYNSCISYNQEILSNKGNSQIENLEIIDMLEDTKYNTERDCISKLMINQYLDSIKNHKHVEILKYIVDNEDVNQIDIGHKFGYSQSYISRIVREFRDGYKKFCEET